MQKENGPMIEPGKTNGTTPGQKPWTKILLVVSLGTNLLIAGLILGNFLQGRNVGNDGDIPVEARMMREMGLGPFLGAFPQPQRRELVRSLRERIGTLQMNRSTLARELTDILGAIRAEPYDHNVLETVFDRQKGRVTERAEVGRDVVLEAILAMSTAERETFADRMERSMARAVESTRRPRP